MTDSTINWQKSSFTNNGDCVEVAVIDGEIAVRNSNRVEAGMILFTRSEIAAWMKGVKAGEFDRYC